MKKKIVLIICITITVIASVLFYFTKKSVGFYNSTFNYIYCTDYETCLHEIGHQVDDENGWVSRTFEWKYAVDWYRVQIYYYPADRDALSNEIMFFPGIGWSNRKSHNPIINSFWTGGWGGYTELYAYVLSEADGEKENVPEMLRDFYNWNRIAELKEQYNGKNIY
jgi:hypothetical protein